jgi:hypothetical protein
MFLFGNEGVNYLCLFKIHDLHRLGGTPGLPVGTLLTTEHGALDCAMPG